MSYDFTGLCDEMCIFIEKYSPQTDKKSPLSNNSEQFPRLNYVEESSNYVPVHHQNHQIHTNRKKGY